MCLHNGLFIGAYYLLKRHPGDPWKTEWGVMRARHLRHRTVTCSQNIPHKTVLTLKVLVTTIDAQWEGMGDVGSARYEPALFPPCPTIRVISYSN